MGKAIEAREKFSPLAACWTNELGGLNRFTHIWCYKDLNERARVREESRRPGGAWPPQAEVRPVRQGKLVRTILLKEARKWPSPRTSSKRSTKWCGPRVRCCPRSAASRARR